MGTVFFFDWEINLIVFLQSFESKFTTTVATFFTILGEEYFLILLLGLIYWCIDKDTGKKLALIICGSALFGSLLKGLILRRRPYMDNHEINCIRAAHPEEDVMIPYLQGYSMPSLHSAMSASLYGSINHYVHKNWTIVLAITLPFCIGLSRQYLGVHYPTDVLSGWLLGALCVLLFGTVEDKSGYKAGFIALLIAGSTGFIFCRDDEFFSLYGTTIGLLLGFIYEEKYVKFEASKKWWSFILRPLLGIVIFVLLSSILKIPVRNISIDEHHNLLMVYRLFRYALVSFCIIGPYTKLFKKKSFNKLDCH